jgi:hypothetical protein
MKQMDFGYLIKSLANAYWHISVIGKHKFYSWKNMFHACRLVEEVILSLKSIGKNNNGQRNEICSCKVKWIKKSKGIKSI